MQCICIDLKSFYASVECVERGLDPLNTNLVVADESRTEKTICLAVTPSLKSYGIGGRARLFEVIQTVRDVNNQRLKKASKQRFIGKSHFATELNSNSALELDFLIAPPQMSKYMEISAKIYDIYLRYIAPEDIHVYSIDEVFIDVTAYLDTYKCTAHDLAMRMIRDVLRETGITATAGIGTNLYLAKIAMDIVAKKIPPDKDGVRIAKLDEMSYREKLWSHQPITDFWRVGKGIANRLKSAYMFTMGDIARASEENEDFLYKMFGINAELLIDHAWGYEPCTMEAIKGYKPENHSLSQGQVLSCPYTFHRARVVIREMTDQLSLDLVRKGLVANQIVLTVGYDHSEIPENYDGDLEINHYGKKTPKSAHGSINLGCYTASTAMFLKFVTELFDNIVDKSLMIRRMYVVANHVIPENSVEEEPLQFSFFDDIEAVEKEHEEQKMAMAKEKQLQKALLSIKDKYGKNAILKGMNFEDGATARERNGQVGGHKA